jgi:pilus assembly protein CpaB
MNGKSLVMLILAVISGLGAMFGTSLLLAKDRGQPAETQDVLVAARDLKVEEMLKPELVQVIKMPKSGVPAGAFTAYKDVEDRWVQIKVLEGEPILDRKLAPRGSPVGLIARIPKGMRAFAVEVNEQTGVSGFILPDHRVDVIQTKPAAPGGRIDSASPPEAETILQDVLVLASGQTFSRPEDRTLVVRTVTLAVSPEQVDALVAARSKGPLSLALRGLNDHDQVQRRPPPPPRQPVPAPVVVAAPAPPLAPPPPPPPPPKPAPPPARFVTIYRGNQSATRIRLGGGDFDEGDDSTVEDAPGIAHRITPVDPNGFGRIGAGAPTP